MLELFASLSPPPPPAFAPRVSLSTKQSGRFTISGCAKGKWQSHLPRKRTALSLGLIYMRLIIDVSFMRVTVYEATAGTSVPSDIDHLAGLRPKFTAHFYFGCRPRPIHHHITYHCSYYRCEPAWCCIIIFYIIDMPCAFNLRKNVRYFRSRINSCTSIGRDQSFLSLHVSRRKRSSGKTFLRLISSKLYLSISASANSLGENRARSYKRERKNKKERESQSKILSASNRRG